MEIGLAVALFRTGRPGGMTTAKADLIFASLPYKILHRVPDPGL